MPHHEIPSAFLIRALARHPAHHCDRCGHRMFVKGASGLCPFCFSDRPVRPVEPAQPPVAATQPFAPRLDTGWQRPALRRRLRTLMQRSRRAEETAALSSSSHAPHPSIS